MELEIEYIRFYVLLLMSVALISIIIQILVVNPVLASNLEIIRIYHLKSLISGNLLSSSLFGSSLLGLLYIFYRTLNRSPTTIATSRLKFEELSNAFILLFIIFIIISPVYLVTFFNTQNLVSISIYSLFSMTWLLLLTSLPRLSNLKSSLTVLVAIIALVSSYLIVEVSNVLIKEYASISLIILLTSSLDFARNEFRSGIQKLNMETIVNNNPDGIWEFIESIIEVDEDDKEDLLALFLNYIQGESKYLFIVGIIFFCLLSYAVLNNFTGMFVIFWILNLMYNFGRVNEFVIPNKDKRKIFLKDGGEFTGYLMGDREDYMILWDDEIEKNRYFNKSDVKEFYSK